MKKENNLTSAKEAIKSTAEKVIKSTEETAEAVLKKASDAVTKENVEKTLKSVRTTAKNVKSKATKVANSAKNTAAKKIDVSLFVQYQGKEVSEKILVERLHQEWLKSHKLSEIKSISIYVKVEDNTAYCLINDKISIDLKLY